MMTWLITSKLGRAVAAAVALVLSIITFGASQRAKGRKAEKQKAEKQAMKNKITATGVEGKINEMSDDGVDASLGDWLHKDE